MIVPDYWAEARKQYRASGKQITVHRYGWSATSETDALANAEARVEEALNRIVAGAKLNKREPKIAYNGAAGVPIREEVLARHGEQVITRNSYGAHCLNSPNALFADVDFNSERSAKPTVLAFGCLALFAVASGFYLRSWGTALGILFVSLFAAAPLARQVARLALEARGGAERIMRTRLVTFLSQNPLWNIRIYRTPAGYRLIATHQSFEASSAEVQKFFAAVSADPIYIQMCINQRCFRARLTAKPWRIGISTHMRPRPGIWPVRPERLAIRNEWLAIYETKAASYSACRYIESLGSGVVHHSLQEVVELHDRESRALVIGTELA
jgi:hypothetical protein